jgi:signal transduction histidine kinase
MKHAWRRGTEPGPAPATPWPAEPRGGAEAVQAVLLAPFSARTWLAVANLVISVIVGVSFWVLLVGGLVLSGALSWVVAVGLILFASTLRLSARMARFDRWRTERFGGARIEPAALPEPPAELTFRQRQRAWALSLVPRRLVVYQLVRPALSGALLFVAGAWWLLFAVLIRWLPGHAPGGDATAVLFCIAAVLLWPGMVRAGSALDLLLARSLLGPSPSGKLSAEVRRLSEARLLAVESAESERRRIERDLHDGFQPKLVSLALELGLAKTQLERDPKLAQATISRAHEEAKTAVQDLRNLVRGIHPSVLDERGLDASLSALVASCPVPVRVEVDLARRLDRTVEATAYYVAAEAITNVTKYSGAARASVTISETTGSLRVRVEDDGCGGARVTAGGGLAGLTARVAAIDGTFRVTSPPGGPTRVEAVIPCGR